MAVLREVEEAVGCPAVLELQFHPTRRWRFDSAFPEKKVALEIEGAVWVQGRHTRGSGFVKDIEKYNEAGILGWRVFRATWTMVKDGTARDVLLRAMGVKGA